MKRLLPRPRNLLALLAGLAVVLVLALNALLGHDDGTGDVLRTNAQKVHCLSARNQQALVEAVMALKLAGQGSTVGVVLPVSGTGPGLPLRQWSDQHDADFNAACSSLVALTGPRAIQSRPTEQPWWKKVTTDPLVVSFLSAFLTSLSAWLVATGARHDVIADRVGVATTEFLKAAEDFRVSRESDPTHVDDRPVKGRERELRQALRRRPPSWGDSEHLLARLTEAGEALLGDWPASEHSQRAGDAQRLLAELEAALDSAVPRARTKALSGGKK